MRREASVRTSRPPNAWQAQSGASLIVAIMMLVVVLLLGISGAQISLQSEKASRNERDRQIAFQAAEAGLMDAELDIENSPNATLSRSAIFMNTSDLGFPEGDGVRCNGGITNTYLGLCSRASPSAAAWEKVDFLDQSDAAQTVPFGRFTGQSFQTGAGSLPARVPRYVIELLEYRIAGESIEPQSYLYRITAIGFGVHHTTQVVLQSTYRKNR